jgi:hypothetical protein
MMGTASSSPFSSLNTTHYGSKICPIVEKILALLSIEGSEWGNFLLGATAQICETNKYERAKSEE